MPKFGITNILFFEYIYGSENKNPLLRVLDEVQNTSGKIRRPLRSKFLFKLAACWPAFFALSFFNFFFHRDSNHGRLQVTIASCCFTGKSRRIWLRFKLVQAYTSKLNQRFKLQHALNLLVCNP